jgi:hypothetical protein
MPTYDCRKENRDPAAGYFPCEVKIVDPQTGERIANVFFASTAPAQLGRFLVGTDGLPLVHPLRKKRRVDNGRGGWRLEVYYDRLETFENRPWKAISLKTGEVVAKSEGCL